MQMRASDCSVVCPRQVTFKAPSPPSTPPGLPPTSPPPAIPPVTLEAVNELLVNVLDADTPVTEESASHVVNALSVMMEATASIEGERSAPAKAVATALVAGVEKVGTALIDAKEVGAPPTEIVQPSLQMSVAKKEAAEVASEPFKVPGKTAQVVLPDTILNGQDGRRRLAADEGVGTMLWSAAANNPHGVDLGEGAAQSSPTLAFSLQSASTDSSGRRRLAEMNITDVDPPIQLKLDTNEPIDKSTTCVGKPDGKKLFEGANDGASPCGDVQQCRSFNPKTEQYDDVDTVEFADGSMGCESSHLSEFMSLKVPNNFDEKIQFANLDVPLGMCLHCACSKGVVLILEKDANASDAAADDVVQNVSLMKLDIGYHEQAVGWKLRNLTQTGVNTSRAWVRLGGSAGRLGVSQTSDNLMLIVSPRGLAETSGSDSYAANVWLDVHKWIKDTSRGASEAAGWWEATQVALPVSVTVRATVSAATTVWGEAEDGACDVDGRTIVLHLGRFAKVPFTACDADALPVNHQLPRPSARNVAGDDRTFSARVASFPAVATTSYRALTEAPVVVYTAGGRYQARCRPLLTRSHSDTGTSARVISPQYLPRAGAARAELGAGQLRARAGAQRHRDAAAAGGGRGLPAAHAPAARRPELRLRGGV